MRTLFFIVAVFTTASAQSLSPTFEVTSVKPCKDGDYPVRVTFSPGGLNWTCFPLKTVISSAYGELVEGLWSPFPMNAIEGGPSWIGMSEPPTNGYSIEARTGVATSVETVEGPMLRALLEDRFKLKARRETRQLRVYGLTIAKGGAKLKPFDGSCVRSDIPSPPDQSQTNSCPISLRGVGNRSVVDMRGVTLDTFAARLSKYAQAGGGGLDGPIVNRTGMTGVFDLHFEYTLDDPTGTGDNSGAIINALQEQLGLKLERSAGPREFLVIEHVERPDAN